MIIIDCEQGTPEWDDCRLGIPTASSFGKILTATGKVSQSRIPYMKVLACERVSGRSEESFVSTRMKEGKINEAESRDIYAMEHTELDVYQVGFVFKDERRLVGCSPDALCDPGGGFETKDAKQLIQFNRLEANRMVTELCIRLYRDEAWIKRLEEELEKFYYELAAMTKKLKEMKHD
jgi:hypothetical protein